MSLFSHNKDYSREIAIIRDSEDPKTVEFAIRNIGPVFPLFFSYFIFGIATYAIWYLCLLPCIGILQYFRFLYHSANSYHAYVTLLGLKFLYICMYCASAYLFLDEGRAASQFYGHGILLAIFAHAIVIRAGLASLIVVVILPPLFVVLVTGLAAIERSIPSFFMAGTYVAAIGSYILIAIYQRDLRRHASDQQRRELMEAQRVATVSRFMGGIAHDFNNLLTVIRGNLDLVREIDDPREQRNLVENALDASNRGSELVGDLMRFTKATPEDLQVYDLAPRTEALLRSVRRIVPTRISIESTVGDAPLRVRAEPAQIEAAILNLIINSTHAIDNRGSISINLRRSPMADGMIELSVADTGEGIGPENLSRVTDPFFTTKPDGVGTGLGLSSIKRFVTEMNGTLEIDSKVGVGTTVTILLPEATQV